MAEPDREHQGLRQAGQPTGHRFEAPPDPAADQPRPSAGQPTRQHPGAPPGPAADQPTGHYSDTQPTTPAEQPTGHYFEARPGVSSRPRTIDVNIDGQRLRFTTDSGVFSAARLDPGTRLLLLEAPPLAEDERLVLDLGCGWGAVACAAALRSPEAEVVAVDVNERALDLAARNAAANGAANVTVARPESVDPTIRFDRILCNPPVRIGKAALHEMLGAWLDRLKPSGRAHLVVHRHLGSDSLARGLEARGHGVARLVSRSGYRILEVRPVATHSP